MRLTIAAKMTSVLLLAGLGSVAALGAFYLFLARTSAEVDFFAVAAEQVSQVRLLHRFADRQQWDERDQEYVRRSIAWFDELTNALAHGGAAYNRRLPGPPPELAPATREARESWLRLRPLLVVIAGAAPGDAKVIAAHRRLHPDVPALQQATEKIIGSLEYRRRLQRRRMLSVLIAVCSLDLLLAVFSFWMTRRYIVRPIQLTERAARKLQKGDFSQHVPVLTQDELATLANSFNDMASDLSRLIRVVEDERQRYHDLIHDLDAIVWEAGADPFRLTFVSQKAEPILGYPADQWLCETDFLERHVHPDDRGSLAGLEASGPGGMRRVEFRLQAADGRYLWLDCTYRTVSAARLRGVMVDISDRKRDQEALRAAHDQLETRVAARTAELLRANEALAAANRELESFSYTIAHDLRAPLRAIAGYCGVLVEDYGPQLHPEIQRILEKVRGNSQQMGRMIDELLHFARLGRQPLDRRPVRPADIARSVLADLENQIGDRPVDISVGDLPCCLADAGLLKQVFANLLGNALKFTGACDIARIEIGCRQDNGEPVYYVRDNGAGFDMRHAGKLFRVFERLHPAEEFEGTGVGLAIVHRIISRHNGRVWAEGEVGRGATFSFTIPDPQSLDEKNQPGALLPASPGGVEAGGQERGSTS